MWRYRLTVEVPYLLFYGTCIMAGNLIINLMTFKVCYNVLGYPEANCSRLGRYTDNETLALEQIVQPHAGVMTAVTEMVPSTIPVLLALVIGSWSDKFGRRPVLLFVLSCMTISFGINAILLLFIEINPWYLMLSTIPNMCCGGVTTFLTVTLAYLNDMSSPDTRAMRMVTFDIVNILATLWGGLSSSYILYATSYSAVYGIGCAIIAISTVYTYYFVPESLNDLVDQKPSFSSVFTWSNVTDLFRIAGKKRRYNRRCIILLIILCVMLLGFIATGETNVKTQFLRNKLGWTLTKKNVFGAWSSMVVVVCTLITTYLLHSKLKVKEVFLIFLALVSGIASSVLYATADSDTNIYISVPVGIFSGLANPMLRTILARMIVPGEMGKIFSLLMVLNSFCLLGSALIYQEIYNTTMITHPETFNYISIGMNTAVSVVVIIVMILELRIPTEKKKIEEDFGTVSTEKLTEH